ncbi:MAG: hypothetical protein QHC40_04265 [Sphingobium sp.]|nr:hypothetical protein [Sphingobium sp.]
MMAVVPAWAQSAPVAAPDVDDATAEGNDIVVTGIRAGLDRATTLKRNADSVVDLISAEDVGRFPDVNVAESVQRITGVQIKFRVPATTPSVLKSGSICLPPLVE